jgi:PAS domain S-box-containing protein
MSFVRQGFLWVAMVAMLAGCADHDRMPKAKAGVIDLRAWNFQQNGIAELDGEWQMQWDRFTDPRAPVDAAQPAVVPGAWNDLPGPGGSGALLPGHGIATYRLQVQCADARRLALSLPFQHSAVRWFVNGAEVARQGAPAQTPQAAQPSLVAQIVHLPETRCPLDITAHVSNFEVRRGGLMRSVELGDGAQLYQRREVALVRDVSVLGGLAVMGLMPLLFFFGRRKDPAPLYFGLFCLVFALGMGMSGTRVLQPLLAPFGWEGHLRVVFLCWIGNNLLYALFLRELYPGDIGRTPTRLLAGWTLVTYAIVLLTPSRIYTHLLPAMAAAAALLALYLTWRLLSIWRSGRRSAGLLLGGMLCFIVATTHDSLQFQHLSRLTLVPFGVLLFVAAPAWLMARRFSRALSVEERVAIENRERADLIVRSTQAGVLDWDAISGRTTYSDRYREMLGYPSGPDAPDPPRLDDLLHPQDLARVNADFKVQLRDRSVKSGVRNARPIEYRLRRADGEYLWIHAEAIFVCGADGRALRFITSFIDISAAKRHEAEMENRIKFIGDLFDSVPLGLALRDPEGTCLFVNRAWERNIGLSRESVVGTSLKDVDDPGARAALALDREAMALAPGVEPPPHVAEYNRRRFMQTRTVMVDAQGNCIGVLTASLDITEMHAAQQALTLERERLRLLVRSTRAGFGDWDAVRDSITYTDRFKEMLGYPADADTSGWPSIFEMMHPDDRERARDQFRVMIRRKKHGGEQEPGDPMSYRLRRTDGSYIWIHAEGISQVDDQGRTRRFITSYLDVTKFHEQEEALRVQMELTRTEQKRLDLVVRAARVGIVDWDGHTHETYYSPRFREIRGYAPDADTSNWPDYFKVMIHPEDRERITKRWIKFILGKGPEGPLGEYYSPEEYRLLCADGDYAWVEVSGIAVRDEKGFVVRWIAAIIDITERRAQREALRASRDQIAEQAQMLEQQNETLKENVRLREEVERIGRHDIKTPLNSIVAVPRLLREERRLGPEADELLGIVERAGYRILSMVNLSLDLYKMEQGSYIFRPDAVDLPDLVGKVLADVRMHAASKQVRLEVDTASVPYAWAEELLCYSLLANLLKNAVEASPEGGVVSLRAQAGAGDTVVVHLHNRGVVPESIRGSFFQKYATLGKASGTGLGTYSARLMARVQDGDIAMRTSEAEGTTLAVTLRAAPAGAVPATLRHAESRHVAEAMQVSAMAPLRILLVDDDEYNLLIVRRFLPSPPFTVDTAINGRVALSAAELQWPDVIFMDLDMPVMGGLEAVQALRAMQRARLAGRCTMVALSSHDDDETRQRALAAGFDKYLTKPVTRDVIHETLLELEMMIGEAASLPQPPARPAPAEMHDPIIADPEVEPVLGEFVASRRELLVSMTAAMEAGNRGEVRRLAHQLAGSFALYGFLWASDQSRWIEHNFSDIDPGQLARIASQLERHLDTAQVRFAAA